MVENAVRLSLVLNDLFTDEEFDMGIGELYEFEKTGRIDPEPTIRKIEEVDCPHCQGTGRIKHCPECRGRGQISKLDGHSIHLEPCPNGCQRPIATFAESE